MTLQSIHDDHFIGGSWVRSESQERIEVINPATEEVWGQVPDANQADVEKAVSAAKAAFDSGVWSRIGAQKRAEYLLRFADELAARGEKMGLVITSENGTPISESSSAAGHSAGILRYYASLADYVDQDDKRPFAGSPNRYTQVYREPRGVALLIAPWNFPLTLVMVKLAPALIAGCTVVIKPASETPLDMRVLIEAAVSDWGPRGWWSHGCPPKDCKGRLHRLNGCRENHCRAVRQHAAPSDP